MISDVLIPLRALFFTISKSTAHSDCHLWLIKLSLISRRSIYVPRLLRSLNGTRGFVSVSGGSMRTATHLQFVGNVSKCSPLMNQFSVISFPRFHEIPPRLFLPRQLVWFNSFIFHQNRLLIVPEAISIKILSSEWVLSIPLRLSWRVFIDPIKAFYLMNDLVRVDSTEKRRKARFIAATNIKLFDGILILMNAFLSWFFSNSKQEFWTSISVEKAKNIHENYLNFPSHKNLTPSENRTPILVIHKILHKSQLPKSLRVLKAQVPFFSSAISIEPQLPSPPWTKQRISSQFKSLIISSVPQHKSAQWC